MRPRTRVLIIDFTGKKIAINFTGKKIIQKSYQQKCKQRIIVPDPDACWAPVNLAVIKPSRVGIRMTRDGTGNFIK